MTQSTTDDATVTDPAPTAWVRENWAAIGLFLVLSVVGITLSTGMLDLGVVDPQPESSDAVTVPGYIYLYASLGALGYIFTKLMAQLDAYDESSELDRLVELGLRIPAAWVLGAGTYLLGSVLLPPNLPSTARFTAGMAFLAGLYVNVTVKSLGSLADRLLGRESSQS